MIQQNIGNSAEHLFVQVANDHRFVQSKGEDKISLTPKCFLDVSNAINQATSLPELLGNVPSLMPITMVSYHHFAGVGAFDFKSLSQYHSLNMPASILEYYNKHHQHKAYPGIVATFSKGHFLWLSDMMKHPNLKKIGHDALVREGLKLTGDGLCIPLYGPNNCRGYMFMALGKNKNACDPILPIQIQTLAQMFHVRYCLIREKLNKQVKLTSREGEVLELISFGKTNQDIAKILNISANTVAGYVAKIFLKLDVSDRVSAAMRSQTIKIVI